MHQLPNNKKTQLPEPYRLDLEWWSRFLRKFNGVEIIIPDDPLMLSIEQLDDIGAMVNCGDAQPLGGASYYGDECWSRPFPNGYRIQK